DAPGPSIAAPRAADDPGSQRRDPTDRVPRSQQRERGQDVLPARRRAQPFATEPEAGPLVAEERSETAGACPPPVVVAADGDRAGAGQNQHAGASIERAQQRGLRVRHDDDSTRETAQPTLQRLALAFGPDGLRSDDERGHCSDRPLFSLPELTQKISKRGGVGRGALVATTRAPVDDGQDADLRASEIHTHRYSFF